MADRIVKSAATSVEICKDVTCMTLRHSYAVDCLRHGVSTRDLQEALGHKRITTTLEYRRYLAGCDPIPEESVVVDDLQASPFRLPVQELPEIDAAGLRMPFEREKGRWTFWPWSVLDIVPVMGYTWDIQMEVWNDHESAKLGQ